MDTNNLDKLNPVSHSGNASQKLCCLLSAPFCSDVYRKDIHGSWTADQYSLGKRRRGPRLAVLLLTKDMLHLLLTLPA